MQNALQRGGSQSVQNLLFKACHIYELAPRSI